MRKRNKIDRVSFYGGLIGALVVNPRLLLDSRVAKANELGWSVVQITPHKEANLLMSILNFGLLMATLGLFNFAPGYLIVFEKEVDQSNKGDQIPKTQINPSQRESQSLDTGWLNQKIDEVVTEQDTEKKDNTDSSANDVSPSVSNKNYSLGEVDGVSFINDSKTTNIHSALQTFQSLEDIIWIVGGDFKSVDPNKLVSKIANKLKACVVIGKDQSVILKVLEANEVKSISIADSDQVMDLAVVEAVL